MILLRKELGHFMLKEHNIIRSYNWRKNQDGVLTLLRKEQNSVRILLEKEQRQSQVTVRTCCSYRTYSSLDSGLCPNSLIAQSHNSMT